MCMCVHVCICVCVFSPTANDGGSGHCHHCTIIVFATCFHRQRALKELNERLSRMDNPTSAWPSLEDGPSDTEPVTTPTGAVVVGGVAGKEGGGAVSVDMEAGEPAISRLAEEGNGTGGAVQTI